MHPTTLALLAGVRDWLRHNGPPGCGSYESAMRDAARAWEDADYPDADPEPEAARARSLDDLARAVAPLETSPLAGGADLRAELEAARADAAFWKSISDTHAHDVVAAAHFITRSRDELDGLRRDVERLERERDAARAEMEAARADAGLYHIHLDDIAAALGIKQPQLDTLAREVAQVMEDRDVARTNTEKIRGRLYAAEADDLRAKLQAMHRRAQKGDAEARRLWRWTLDLRAEIDTLAQRLGKREAELRIAREEAAHWRTVAEELAARPRLRDRVWRWVGVGR